MLAARGLGRFARCFGRAPAADGPVRRRRAVFEPSGAWRKPLSTTSEASRPAANDVGVLDSHYYVSPQPSSSTEPRKRLEKTPFERQLLLEEETLNDAIAEYNLMVQGMLKLGKAADLRPIQRLLARWYHPLCEAIVLHKEKVLDSESGPKHGATALQVYGPLLLRIPAEHLAVITMHTVVGLCLKDGGGGAKYVMVTHEIGELVQAESHMLQLRHERGPKAVRAFAAGYTLPEKLEKKVSDKRKKGTSSSEKKSDFSTPPSVKAAGAAEVADAPPFMHSLSAHDVKAIVRLPTRIVNLRAKKVFSPGLDATEEWPAAAKVQLGAALLQLFLEVATDPDTFTPLFLHVVETVVTNNLPKSVGMVKCAETLLSETLNSPEFVERAAVPRYLPMLVEPQKWRGYDVGGYLRLRAVAMRTHGCAVQKEALRRSGNLPQAVLDGLDAMGKVPWQINKRVFLLVQEAWASGQVFPDLPPKRDFELPDRPQEEDERLLKDWQKRCLKVKQRNSELHSMRCDVAIKLAIAARFVDEEAMYFPYNLDFRGRAYPVPPNLNHLGSDVCRGMLRFAEAKPLGEEGLRWLKIHLANLFGHSKLTLEARVCFANDHLADVHLAAEDPFGSARWWTTADDPWQALAAAIEISEALKHAAGPSFYPCRLPVHADGSCNGLQHYASLGRDEEGGKQVNVIPNDQGKPMDVYAGVCALVSKRVARDAAQRFEGEDDTFDPVLQVLFDREEQARDKAALLAKADEVASRTEVAKTRPEVATTRPESMRPPPGGVKKHDATEFFFSRSDDVCQRSDALKAARASSDAAPESGSASQTDSWRAAEAEVQAAKAQAEALEPLVDFEAFDQHRYNRRLALILDGMISRKVVKQTVMTSVYGVTFVGARDQIKARITERLEEVAKGSDLPLIEKLTRLGAYDKFGEVDDQVAYQCATYAAKHTLECLAELFSSARDIMSWLGKAAGQVSAQNQPVSWITPLGLPVVQPYRRDDTFSVRTLAQTVLLVDHSDRLPVSAQRQKSAFPPNFIHSLDSTHMLMTAIEMDRRGLHFAAVHDSYWTHARDMRQMNSTLRHCFLDLYSKPVLEDLLRSLQRRHPTVAFEPLPERGSLQLDLVLDATYFFS
ncbi:hypothetical protein M885DRAFT_508934 [Pelagophyceae sp. CCMP2097]|nr:hypothetical protein M885DRAFT_508934 [Pelagophyceae sp. CCMP2097]|mmetsp:Transcript_27334/g.91891  ORF Transcript_27334/g.91891 Transcript_27334/m.91891 type:complete len:1121 (-) Transcript_27334:47-3409(-)